MAQGFASASPFPALAAHGLKVLPPSDALKSGLHQVGERLTAEWLIKAGSDGQAVIEAYRRSSS